MNEYKTNSKREEETKPKKIQPIKVKAIPIRKILKTVEIENDMKLSELKRPKVDVFKFFKSSRLEDYVDEMEDEIERKMNGFNDESVDDSYEMIEMMHSFEMNRNENKDDFVNVFTPEDHLAYM